MTTEQQSSNKKTWAELAEEEDDEIENGQFTTNSETLDKNEIPSQPGLTKSVSEFQSKPRNEKQRNNKQRENGGNGLKNYKQNNSLQVKGNNKQNRQSKSNYDEVYDALFETTNQEIILRVKTQNKSENLEAVKEYFEKQYQNIKAFPRNDINQVDLLTSPKIGLYILEDLRFKVQIGDSQFAIYYPQFPNEQLSEYYAKKRYLEKEKKSQQSNAVFQRSAINSKVNDQQDYYEKSDGSSNTLEKVQYDQPQIYKEKDYQQDEEQEYNQSQNRQKYEKKDFNKQTNYRPRNFNKQSEQYDQEQDWREYQDEKYSNYKSHKYRNEQHIPKESYQNQKYHSNKGYEYTEKTTSNNNQSPFQQKEQNKDYRNNYYYQNNNNNNGNSNSNNNNNNNNNHNYNQKRSYQQNNKQKSDQYVIYEEKQKKDYYEEPDNQKINEDNFEGEVKNPQKINQAIQQQNLNEENYEDTQIDSENEQDQEQVEENKSPNKNKKKKKNKKAQKTSKPNDTNFFGILQSVTK
ncbi:unnamed protein product (macronuclear) [Paramecium tetraurelia]|uniref:Uncharacterized protein n=1 Tax=Paramecium tetraurelia TaxID=5888 RepID=A0E1D8_PARTE|nr:uncharacterized protein GSPATT00022274001 [Paramecium tetraurelia]CAK89105.1 unnamed protein product [Paramecium tetraurelia]|eukprot:XP_001456502.1 hypothetical protein (macronuclear) [Paramecium tetraurelia strain d4-2]